MSLEALLFGTETEPVDEFTYFKEYIDSAFASVYSFIDSSYQAMETFAEYFLPREKVRDEAYFVNQASQVVATGALAYAFNSPAALFGAVKPFSNCMGYLWQCS